MSWTDQFSVLKPSEQNNEGADRPGVTRLIPTMTPSVCNNELPVPPPEALTKDAQPDSEGGGEKHSYHQILKSSALIGGSSFLNVGIGIVRTKAMAILLGPAGFGLFGLYSSVLELTQTLAGIGINSSGVRQIAEAVGSGNSERIARTTAVLRKMSIILGVLGAVILVLFSRQVSTVTFGSDTRAAGVSLLAAGVFFRLVAGGQGALIQGLRRISDFAKMGVLGALFGTIIGIVLVYFFKEKGIVPSLVSVAAMMALFSHWYSRKVGIKTPALRPSEVRDESAALLKLGFAFMSSGLMTIGVAYVVRIVVLRKVGFEATGLYQAAWTLGGLYVGFILQAMGADFYPRLTANANHDPTCNRLVNEQTRVGLLIAVPGVIATLTFAPLVIVLFYSAKFIPAVAVLRWVCLGTALQVVSWPIGFIILAKGRQNLFFWSEFAWTVVSLLLAWICVTSFGVVGAGIAFFGSYVFHVFLIYVIAGRLSGFRWSKENTRTALMMLFITAMIFCVSYLLPLLWSTLLGILALLLTTCYSIRVLLQLVSLDQIPQSVRRFLVGFGLKPSV